MKRNFARNLRIIIKSAWSLAVLCTKIVYLAKRNRLSREKVDEIVRAWSIRILQIIKLKVHLENPHQLDFRDGKRYVLMANHSSLFDIPIAYASISTGTFRMIAKQELFKIPLFGHAMRAAEIPSINRQNRAQAIKDLNKARLQMEDGVALWVFPEGTRSSDGRIQPLKKGGFILAIETGAVIVPIGIRGASKVLPKHTWDFHLNQEASVHIGTPIQSSDYTLKNKDELIARVAQELRELVHVD